MEPISHDDSYTDRRQLFKNIWDTSLSPDDKYNDMINKPKIIKTQRLNDDGKVVGKKKKERIKTLRAVCNKILDYCDKQDAVDIFYEQMSKEHDKVFQDLDLKLKRSKSHRSKKKIVRAKSLYAAGNYTAFNHPEWNYDFIYQAHNNISKFNTDLNFDSNFISRALVTNSKPTSPTPTGSGTQDTDASPRKALKKRSRHKKALPFSGTVAR